MMPCISNVLPIASSAKVGWSPVAISKGDVLSLACFRVIYSTTNSPSTARVVGNHGVHTVTFQMKFNPIPHMTQGLTLDQMLHPQSRTIVGSSGT